jgi:hypothetical protein
MALSPPSSFPSYCFFPKKYTVFLDQVFTPSGTTGLSYNTQTKMEGIGYICEQAMGVNIHSGLAVPTNGLTLGVLAQSSYNRAQPKNTALTHDGKQRRALEEKESYRWVQTLGSSTDGLPEGADVVSAGTGISHTDGA